MSTLLDTNVLSELLRASPDAAVVAWVATQPLESLYVSAVTQAEMLLGAHLLPGGKRRQSLEASLAQMFAEDFARRILSFDSAAVPDYVEVVSRRRTAGRPISQFDAQIAATALRHRSKLATRNPSDFEGCGLELVDPWMFAG
jgi:hypothetical protein